LDRDNTVNKYLKTHLSDVEGYSDEVYDDHKGIPTVGTGVNLNSPTTQKSLLNLGYEPARVTSGEIQLSPEELDRIHDDHINETKNIFNTIKSQSFPQKNLNEAQEAAMLSLMYNSPKLVGPSLRQHLNNNDDLSVMKEIVLNSNRENNPGLQLRRIKEAELYGGPLDFQQMLKTLTPEQKKQVYDSISQIKNEEQRLQALEKYAQFDPEYKSPLEKPKFYKIAGMLGK
jgi:GH24 family phage-related lysozyme (muramidase)